MDDAIEDGRSESEFQEVLGAAETEVARQEGRVDVKAGQLLTLTSTMTAVVTAAITVFARHAPILIVAPLAVAVTLWVSAVFVLLHRVVRPRLNKNSVCSFLSSSHIDDLLATTLTEYLRLRVDVLGKIVLARYRALQIAADLFFSGFAFLLVTIAVVIVTAIV